VIRDVGSVLIQCLFQGDSDSLELPKAWLVNSACELDGYPIRDHEAVEECHALFQ
jgi:hypothetical protein